MQLIFMGGHVSSLLVLERRRHSLTLVKHGDRAREVIYVLVSVRLGIATPLEGLRYSMSLPVSTVVSGIDSMEILEENLMVSELFQTLSVRFMVRRNPLKASRASNPA